MKYRNSFKKFGVIFLSAFLMIGYMGCGLLDPEEDTDEVTVSITNDADLATINLTGTSVIVPVEGTIEGSAAPSSISAIMTNNDATGTADGIQINTTQQPDLDKIEIGEGKDMQIEIVVNQSACNGTYTLTISATVGGATNTASQTIVLEGATDCSQTGTPVTTSSSITLGAQNANSGSYLDADAMTAYNSTSVSGNESKIDILLGYAGAAGELRLYSPAEAKNDGFIGSWTSPPSTQILPVTSTFDQITTQEEIDALWTGTPVNELAITGGEVVVVETTEGEYVLIKVESVSAQSQSAEISVIGKY
ncbi:MAG: hypothetical protein GF401_10925 [Chitinivibrionales bacterium]|nr:hypothetical protein [Chitinivibrionales bacterium]